MVYLAKQVQKVQTDQRVLQEHQVTMVLMERRGSLANQVHRVQQVNEDLQVKVVQQDQWVFLGHLDLLELQVRVVRTEQVEN